MKNGNNTFVADSRNLGGRTEIVELLHNHQYSLKIIKPVLKITSPHPHVNQGRSKKTIADSRDIGANA